MSDDHIECSICFSKLNEEYKTECNHIFCTVCIIEWYKKQKNCPLCRRTIENPYKDPHKDSIIDSSNYIINNNDPMLDSSSFFDSSFLVYARSFNILRMMNGSASLSYSY